MTGSSEPVTPAAPGLDRAGRSRLARRAAWLVLAGAVAVGGVLLGVEDPAPRPGADEQAVDRDLTDVDGSAARESSGLAGEAGTTALPGDITTTTQPGATTTAPLDPRGTSQRPTTPGRPGLAERLGLPGGSGTATGTGSGGGNGATGRPGRPTGRPGTTSPTSPTSPTTAPTGPSRPPGSTSTTAPVGRPGPTQPWSRLDPSVDVVAPSTATTIPPEPADIEGCRNLGLMAIGTLPTAPSPQLVPLAPRFRAMAPAELDADAMVCAHPIEIWRDLAVQRLVTRGQADGALITALDGTSIVLRIDEIEWTGYRFRYGGAPTGVNFLGAPVGRLTMGPVRIIRTTHGGLVSRQADTIGIPVVGGAWDFWMARGGPTGELGVPEGNPTGSFEYGAHQDFSNGWIGLPGVRTDVESWVQPASRYEWHPTTPETDPGPPEVRNTILQTTGISYYVDHEGVRHWLRTTADWSCARWNLGALEIPVRGFVIARQHLGPAFVCPSR